MKQFLYFSKKELNKQCVTIEHDVSCNPCIGIYKSQLDWFAGNK